MLAMAPPAPKPVLLRPADLASRKQAGLPITMLTAWDALSGTLVAEAGADVDNEPFVALHHRRNKATDHVQDTCSGQSNVDRH